MIPNEIFAAFADAIAERVAARLQTERRGKKLYTVKEAAEYIGRSPSGMKHLTEIPKVKNGRRVHYDVKDLDRWVEENKQ